MLACYSVCTLSCKPKIFTETSPGMNYVILYLLTCYEVRRGEQAGRSADPPILLLNTLIISTCCPMIASPLSPGS